MAVVYTFESGRIPGVDNPEGGYVKVAMVMQYSGPTYWSAGLTEPDFTATAITCDYVFSMPEISRRTPIEPGLVELQALDLTCDNDYLVAPAAVASGAIAEGMIYKVNGYTSVTYNSVVYSTNDIFIGLSGHATYTTVGTGTVTKALSVYNIFTVLPQFDRTIHLRVYYKATSAGTYVCKGHFILDDSTIKVNRPMLALPETWDIDCTFVDSIRQFEKRTLADSLEDSLLHVDYDYLASNKLFTFIGTTSYAFSSGSVTVYPGAYSMTRFMHKQYSGDNRDNWQGATESSADIPFRYIKIVEMFSAIQGYLGCAGSVNDGAAWSTVHSWVFYTNDHASTGVSGGTNLVGYGIDSLYIPSGLFYSGAYQEYGSFFDRSKDCPHSFFHGDSYIDLLTNICISLNCIFWIGVNASGQRYLAVKELATRDTAVSITDLGSVVSSNSEPCGYTISGMTITPPKGANMSRGAGDSNSKRVQTFFSVANFIRNGDRFANKLNKSVIYGDTDGAGHYNIVTDANIDVLSSLYVSGDTPTGSRSSTPGTGLTLATMYSVCAIHVQQNGEYASTDPGNIPAYGELTGGIILYPNSSAPYCEWTEVPAMALCHALFNNVTYDVDPVGFLRSNGELFNVTVDTLYDVRYPPFNSSIPVDGITKTFQAAEVIENLETQETTFVGYLRS